jgi:hypothetical protein
MEHDSCTGDYLQFPQEVASKEYARITAYDLLRAIAQAQHEASIVSSTARNKKQRRSLSGQFQTISTSIRGPEHNKPTNYLHFNHGWI